jgi:manganese-dependent inorganic pyrophosphatase
MRQLAVKSRQTLFPVLDRQSGTKIVGVVTKTDLVDPPRMRLALVDHNEFSQAVDGVEEAEIVEVMDHHRLGSQVVTRDPIRFLNEPVGSTSTLVARRFFHRDEEPEAAIAICLCAGILSDTLNLTSPTTTDVDRKMLEWLCGIAKIDAKQFTDEFFSTGSLLRSGMSAEDIIQSDRKEFVEFGSRISLSQIEETGMFGFDDVRPKLQKALEDLCLREGYRVAALMLTDIVNHNSLVLAVGDRRVLDSLEFERKDDNLFKAEGIVSRKKQLFPAFSLALKSVE